MTGVRKASRRLHRDFSYFFAGVILIYAISGIALNHKATFNSNYDISRHTFAVEGGIPPRSGITEEWVRKNLLEPVGEENAYTKHYFPKEGTLKVFLKGGSSVVADLGTGQAEYEAFKRRPFFSAISRLHYNPGRWWTVFFRHLRHRPDPHYGHRIHHDERAQRIPRLGRHRNARRTAFPVGVPVLLLG